MGIGEAGDPGGEGFMNLRPGFIVLFTIGVLILLFGIRVLRVRSVDR
jgi:hypothetical protein